MGKTVSLIISVDNAVESDLSIPLSSINNQLGCDFAEVEVLLIDNGNYKLKQPELFNIFRNLDIKYLKTSKALSWPDALQLGIQHATGKFVMLMGSNGQLNQLSTLQGFFEHAKQHPHADVLSGLIINQFFNDDLVPEYEVGRDYGTVRGRWISKAFLDKYQIEFHSEYAPYAEEYVTRLLNHFASEDVEVEEIVYARFMSRFLDPHVLEPTEQVVNAEWLVMMAAYMEKIKQLDPAQTGAMLSRFVIQFFSRTREVTDVRFAGLAQGLFTVIKLYADNWNDALKAIGTLTVEDKNANAPWNKYPENFSNYLYTINTYLVNHHLLDHSLLG